MDNNTLTMILIIILSLIILVSLIALTRKNRDVVKKMPIAKNVALVISDKVDDRDFLMAILNLIKIKTAIDKEANVDNRQALHKMIDDIYKEVYGDDR